MGYKALKIVSLFCKTKVTFNSFTEESLRIQNVPVLQIHKVYHEQYMINIPKSA